MSVDRNDERPIIVGVQFDESICAITYMEQREVSEGALIQRTLMIDPDQVEELIMDAQESIRALLDEGLLVIRKPASKLSRAGALARVERGSGDDEED